MMNPGRTARKTSPGSALIVVLWALVLLGVGVISVLHATRLDLKVAKNFGDRVQARFLALAGVERAKAAIYQEREALKTGDGRFSTRLFDDPATFKDVALGRGSFQVFRRARALEKAEGSSDIIHGLEEEESRLNVNLASIQELQKLYGMTEEVAASIKDWRDEDSRLTPMGAEEEYYAGLRPSYRIRNAPFETLRELLLVQGVTPDLLLGEDVNANGLLDPEENDGARSLPADNADGFLDAGWSEYLTLDSSVLNLNRRGEHRVNITSASAQDLGGVEGLSADLAGAIVEHRKVKQAATLDDLLDVKRVEKIEQPAGNPSPASGTNPAARPAGNNPTVGPTPPGRTPTSSGRRGSPATPSPEYREVGSPLISQELLIEIADGLTTRGHRLEGAVNINTASTVVLACLPGMTEDLAIAVVDHRRRSGFFSNIAELLNVPGITRQIFKQVNPRVSVRSGTFRILSEGRIPSSGARKRVEVVIRLDEHEMKTLYYREDS